MHVGRAVCGIAQGRRLERMLQCGRVRKTSTAPDIVVSTDTDVVKRIIGEIPTAMARGAFAFAGEKRKTALGRSAHLSLRLFGRNFFGRTVPRPRAPLR